jgi:hypothetical protein
MERPNPLNVEEREDEGIIEEELREEGAKAAEQKGGGEIKRKVNNLWTMGKFRRKRREKGRFRFSSQLREISGA